ncbi:MAG: hypothetical protein GY865_17600 [candidate division Zixibacteria bacterium]|nr:hypothetical protein [candidate division Zixibacteria bacterium]
MSAQLDPNSATNFFNTAYIFIEMKVFDSAQLYVNAGLKIDPKYPRAGKYQQSIQEGLSKRGY